LKNTLERRIVKYLEEKMGFDFSKYNILMVAAVDRFGMAESFADTGAKILFGDLIFGLGLPLAIKSFKTLHKVVSILAPFIVLLPFELLYPTGSKQNSGIKNADKYAKYYEWADIIAGDFHFINHYSPDNLENKIIITNTVTEDNIKKLKKKGVKLLITTTPEFNGRSFGTNVMEAVLVSILNQPVENITVDDYNNLLDKLNFLPRIINFD